MNIHINHDYSPNNNLLSDSNLFTYLLKFVTRVNIFSLANSLLLILFHFKNIFNIALDRDAGNFDKGWIVTQVIFTESMPLIGFLMV